MKTFVCLGIAILPLIIKYILEQIYDTKRCSSDNDYKCSTFFTTYKNYNCRNHLFKSIECSETCSYVYLKKIKSFMENATQSISLCVCLLTLYELCDAIIQARNRGVRVRLISDNQMIQVEAAKKDLLLKSGINIKVQPTKINKTLMHHKFCLVDEFDPIKAGLFYGSLNLTMQGLSSNWEVVVFTKDQKLIKSFSEEFENLWNIFPDVDTISI